MKRARVMVTGLLIMAMALNIAGCSMSGGSSDKDTKKTAKEEQEETTPAPTEKPTDTPTPTSTPKPTGTPTSTPTPTNSPTPTNTPTPTPVPDPYLLTGASAGMIMPTGISYCYSAGSKSLGIEWDGIADIVDHYDIALNGIEKGSVTENGCHLENVDEGITVTFGVRAVNADGYHTEWVEMELNTTPMETPDNMHRIVNGTVCCIYWDPVEGAEGYEISFYPEDLTDRECIMSTTNAGFLDKYYEGETNNICVRAFKKSGDGIQYSLWRPVQYEDPVIPVSEYYFYETCTLDYDRLVSWLNSHNLVATVSKDEQGNIYVQLVMQDDLNSGLWNSIKRVGGDLVSTGLTALVGGLLDPENLIGAAAGWLFGSSDIGEAVKDLGSSAAEDASFEMLKTAVTSIENEINSNYVIVYTWVYSDTAHAPDYALFYFPQEGRPNFESDLFDASGREDDGTYHFGTPEGVMDYYAGVRTDGDYWVIVGMRFK